MCQYFCCQSRACSVCCTVWCIFGFLITGFFSILSDSDKVYALVGVTGTNNTDDAVGAFAGSAAIYAVCSIGCGICWIYHDFIKKKKLVKRKYTTEAHEVELQTHLLTTGANAEPKTSDPVEL
eukprot:INCI7443.5.p1 GENE.INCI7443.5~~INCI7443.5.p1  ORF type:complete len:136 (+),score=32.28 INCI7443.5:42-410(+)